MAERAPSVRRPRGPSHFRQRDVTAAVKAVEQAGKPVLRVEIEPGGKVVIVTSGEAIAVPEADEWEGASP